MLSLFLEGLALDRIREGREHSCGGIRQDRHCDFLNQGYIDICRKIKLQPALSVHHRNPHGDPLITCRGKLL
jgi:hypothetical protein